MGKTLAEVEKIINDCEMWVAYPLMPVKRGDEIGCLWIHDVPTVHLINPAVIEGLGQFKQAEVIEYKTIEKMLRDGWTVF